MESIANNLETAVENLAQKNSGRVLDVLQYTDPRLREVSRPVLNILDPEFQGFLDDMVATMEAYKALGLAAVQVGVPYCALVVRDNDGSPLKIINPVVVDTDGEIEIQEGCLSFAGLFLKIARPEEVTIKYFDETGVQKTSIGNKLLGRAILHEIGHLEGKLFTDEISPILRSGVLRKYELRKRKVAAFLKLGNSGKVSNKKTKAERKKEKKKRASGKGW